jgi:biopolymer transport protein ExbD
MSRKKYDMDATKMDMTPMIDVVFQLIIFFMLVTDMTQQELADLKLPIATESVKDEQQEGRLTVNLLKDGTIQIKRKSFDTLDDPGTQQVIRALLADAVLKGKKDKDGLSERALLIRADQTTEFKHVQKLLRICGEMGIRIYKIHLAAAQPAEA